jgi:hypothetical protein
METYGDGRQFIRQFEWQHNPVENSKSFIRRNHGHIAKDNNFRHAGFGCERFNLVHFYSALNRLLPAIKRSVTIIIEAS